jgi:hypothetical protein
MRELFAKIKNLKNFKTLVIRNEQVSFNRKDMLKILGKRAPYNLEELRLENCQID